MTDKEKSVGWAVWDAYNYFSDIARDLGEDVEWEESIAGRLLVLLVTSDHVGFEPHPDDPEQRVAVYHEDGELDDFIEAKEKLVELIKQASGGGNTH